MTMKKKNKYNVAVVGAKGAVGHEMIRILEERNFPIAEFYPFGSSRTKGTPIHFNGKDYPNQELKCEAGEFDGIDIVLSSPGAAVSKRFVPHAIKSGALVIDNTSAFRMHPKVPLVIPEVNGQDLKRHNGIIANPNCSTIIMLMAIAPLYRRNKIRRVICATYQAVSGAGATGMVELYKQSEEFVERVKHNPAYSKDLLSAIRTEIDQVQSDSKPLQKQVFPHQIAFNLFSHNSDIEDGGYNGEELKMIAESRKILNDDKIRIVTTCIRVPILRAHSEVLYLEFENKMSPEKARDILSKAPGIEVVDSSEKNYFPMPIKASGGDTVLVGRIREDLSMKNGLALFAAGDQLRKGAALNAVQIAEALIK